jgi:hypothetical protein
MRGKETMPHQIRFGIALAVIAISGSCGAQQSTGSQRFKPRADVVRNGNSVAVDAAEPRPLKQAVEAIAEEYGWRVDYEDPVYDPVTETVDANDASWVSAHPEEPRVKLPNGHNLHAEFSLGATGKGRLDQKSILRSLVDANTNSGNPGRFTVLSETDGGLVVSGITGSLAGPVLSAPISMPPVSRTLHETLDEVFEQLKLETNATIVLSAVPLPLLDHIQVTVGGEQVPARDLLRNALNQSGVTLHWTMLFEPTFAQYHFNIERSVLAYQDAEGNRRLTPLDTPQRK